MKEVIGDITASMFFGVMLLALALGIAFVISLKHSRFQEEKKTITWARTALQRTRPLDTTG